MTQRISLWAAALLGATVVACSGGGAAATSSQGLTIRTVDPSTVGTPAASPAPAASVTPSPVGFAPGSDNAGSFSAPPPNPVAEPASTRGIARLSAPALGVNHYIEVVGVVNNEMEAPDDGQYAVGWFPEYGMPGSG
ncbi:MAG: hypothetical protein WC273_11165, partial [Dehalococcoidia bacterium]